MSTMGGVVLSTEEKQEFFFTCLNNRREKHSIKTNPSADGAA